MIINLNEMVDEKTGTLIGLMWWRGETKEIRSRAKLIVSQRANEISLEHLCNYIRRLPIDEREPYLDILDTRIGVVDFENYSQISKIGTTHLAAIRILVDNKLNHFFKEIFKNGLSLKQLTFLTESPYGNTKFRNLLKQRGFSTYKKNELLYHHSELTRFLRSFITKEINEIKELTSSLSDALYKNDKKGINEIIKILSNIVDK